MKTDYLFTLIKSLGKAEKRHFKVYSSKYKSYSGNIYVQLFDAIDKQKTYDEQELKSKKLFHDLPSLKKWLYKSILRSLGSYHSDVSMDVRSMINDVEILYNKSLIDHCLRHIHRVKKIIHKYELYDQWLELLKWEYKIAVQKFDLRIRILEEEKTVLSLLDNQRKYRDAINLFLMKYQRFGVERNSRELIGMKKMLTSPLLKDEKQALSFLAKQNFFDCHNMFSLSKGDYKNSYRFSKKITDMYHARPEMISINVHSYLIRLNNFLIACSGMNKYEEMLTYLDKLKEIRNDITSPLERTTVFFYQYHLLNYYIGSGLFDESEGDVKRIEHELVGHERNLNQLQKITLYAIIAQIYFGMKDYKRSLFWMNKIMSFGEMKIRTDIECFIRLFYLIVHYEAKSDMGFMGSLFRSTYHFLNKQQRIYKFESVMMLFFRKYIFKGNWKKNRKESFIELKKKLEQLSKDAYEKHALNYFDFISWLDSKIENKPFAEIVMDKAQKAQ